MNKQILLEKILYKLKPHRALAEGFLLLIKESNDTDFIEELYQCIKTSIKSTTNNKLKQKIQDTIKTLQEKEKAQERENQLEADKIFEEIFNTLE